MSSRAPCAARPSRSSRSSRSCARTRPRSRGRWMTRIAFPDGAASRTCPPARPSGSAVRSATSPRSPTTRIRVASPRQHYPRRSLARHHALVVPPRVRLPWIPPPRGVRLHRAELQGAPAEVHRRGQRHGQVRALQHPNQRGHLLLPSRGRRHRRHRATHRRVERRPRGPRGGHPGAPIRCRRKVRSPHGLLSRRFQRGGVQGRGSAWRRC